MESQIKQNNVWKKKSNFFKLLKFWISTAIVEPIFYSIYPAKTGQTFKVLFLHLSDLKEPKSSKTCRQKEKNS
jgi:hypothetical protein